jgi:hypothetical protein
MIGALLWVACALAQVPAPAATTDTDLLAGSELLYRESGGFAGRTHEARFVAANGVVEVRYRAPDARNQGEPLTGPVDRDAYIRLWREAERCKAWDRTSATPIPGAADMIVHELQLRAGTRETTITWTEESSFADLAGLGRQILAAGRQFAMNQ